MDLGFLRPLYDEPGDVVSVYLDTSRDHENAPHEIELRWRAARDQLTEAGADSGSLELVAELLTDPALAAPGRAVFAREDSILLTEPLPHPPRRQIARLAPLPHVMPLLAQAAPRLPHLRVTARHDGGQLVAVSGAGPAPEEDVAAARWPVHKTGKGGWAAQRYENSVEETWEVNAKELAERVTSVAARIGAELIVLAGDAKAKTMLTDQLAGRLSGRVVNVDSEVGADSADLAKAADRAIAERIRAQSRERFADWQRHQAHQQAVAGLPDSLAALREGSTAYLLLVDHPESTATAWIGPEGTDLAVDPADLPGVRVPRKDRADAAIARAAATTDAELFFLPGQESGGEDDFSPQSELERRRPRATSSGAVPDGICATLRYPGSVRMASSSAV